MYYVPRLLSNEGGYATHHVEDAAIVALKPPGLGFEEAAALPLSAGTAWECLIERGKLEPGERILVHAGTGGVGIYAIQIARATGAFVVTTCRSEQADFVKSLGADIAIDYRAPDLDARLANATDGRGFDLVLDTIGGDAIERGCGQLADGGRLVSIVDHALPQNLIRGWERNIQLHLVLTTQRRQRLELIGALVEKGLLVPVIERTLPLEDAAQAHRLIEAGGRRGKIVLRVAS
ncbi:quinone oxidoreductase family protein [Luteimonas salinilitoris]|uniref:Zinc-binding alcohol dehydrogenase family protein n=1 Tax=Luteimonas salinilitoris TaxID=3237697 RepID=A0ABV4HXJ0_9GAMM